MENDFIVSEMNSYLHTATTVLSDWLGKILPKTSKDWWEDSVLGNLTNRQWELAKENHYSELSDFDLAALLGIADKSWYAMRNVIFLPNRERECIREMKRVRNNWAHLSAALPGKDAILKDLATLHDFFEQRGCEDRILEELEQFLKTVKSPIAGFESSPRERIVDVEAKKGPKAKPENDIPEMSLVYLIGNPEVRGMVKSVSDFGDTKKYEVFVNGDIKTF